MLRKSVACAFLALGYGTPLTREQMGELLVLRRLVACESRHGVLAPFREHAGCESQMEE
jgi:hypothetical protein